MTMYWIHRMDLNTNPCACGRVVGLVPIEEYEEVKEQAYYAGVHATINSITKAIEDIELEVSPHHIGRSSMKNQILFMIRSMEWNHTEF